MTKTILSFLFLFLLNIQYTFSQTETTFFKHINYLCSKEVHGRGAEFKGDSIAAQYLSRQYKKFNLTPIDKSYLQHFSYDVNTFPGAYSLTINGKKLKAGVEVVAHAGSKSGKGKFKVIRLTAEDWNDPKFRTKFLNKPLTGKVLLYDHALNDTKIVDYFKLKLAKVKAAGLIELLDTDPIANEFTDQIVPPTFLVNRQTLGILSEIKTVEFDLTATLVKGYKSQNVVGLVKGSEQPEQYLIVSAHYDHIGHLGKETMLQGANDNASGVAMLLSLAEYFGKPENQPKKSILFICFAAEEIGLLGSQHYVKNPLVPLEQTDFVLNLDLMGSGSEGITVVNGKELDLQYQLLTVVNEHHNYVPDIKNRANKANSDHFYFTEKEVPAFFVYARGTVGGYHNVEDTIDQLERGQFEGLYGLFIEFLKTL